MLLTHTCVCVLQVTVKYIQKGVFSSLVDSGVCFLFLCISEPCLKLGMIRAGGSRPPKGLYLLPIVCPDLTGPLCKVIDSLLMLKTISLA